MTVSLQSYYLFHTYIMGNSNKKIVLQSAQRTIVVDEMQGKTLYLNELPIFPHGYDGLHIWEAGIVLSRYILYNKELFAGKTVLELGSGVGIGGLSVAKFTDCKKCLLSDYVPEIVDNIKINIQKNQATDKAQVAKINWMEFEKVNLQFDIIIGSDIVYFGCPVHELYNLIKRCMVEGGITQIIIPDRKSYAELFLQQVEPNVFEVYKKKLEDPLYRQSPLPNKVEGLKEYNLLVDIDFYVYTLVKKGKGAENAAEKIEEKGTGDVQQKIVEKREEQKGGQQIRGEKHSLEQLTKEQAPQVEAVDDVAVKQAGNSQDKVIAEQTENNQQVKITEQGNVEVAQAEDKEQQGQDSSEIKGDDQIREKVEENQSVGKNQEVVETNQTQEIVQKRREEQNQERAEGDTQGEKENVAQQGLQTNEPKQNQIQNTQEQIVQEPVAENQEVPLKEEPKEDIERKEEEQTEITQQQKSEVKEQRQEPGTETKGQNTGQELKQKKKKKKKKKKDGKEGANEEGEEKEKQEI